MYLILFLEEKFCLFISGFDIYNLSYNENIINSNLSNRLLKLFPTEILLTLFVEYKNSLDSLTHTGKHYTLYTVFHRKPAIYSVVLFVTVFIYLYYIDVYFYIFSQNLKIIYR